MRISLSAVLLLLISAAALGQTANGNQNIGLPMNGVFSGSDFDMVQVNNGDLRIEIPLYSLQGRGLSAGFSYVYDSKGWERYQNGIDAPVIIRPMGTGPGQAQPGNNMQWTLAGPLSNNQGSIAGLGGKTVGKTCTGGSYTQITYNYSEPNATTHAFPMISTAGSCTGGFAGAWPGGLLYATDGSGVALQLAAGTANPQRIIFKDGRHIYSTLNGQGVVTGYVLEDPNGNQITKAVASSNPTTITDTLGRNLNSDLVLNAGKYELSYYDSTDATPPQKIKVTKSNVTVHTSYCGQDPTCTDYSATWQSPTEILLPNI